MQEKSYFYLVKHPGDTVKMGKIARLLRQRYCAIYVRSEYGDRVYKTIVPIPKDFMKKYSIIDWH